MAMVIVDDSCLKQVDSLSKLVWGSAAAWRCSTFTEWTLAMTSVMIDDSIINIVVVIIIFMPTRTKPQEWKLNKMLTLNSGWNGFLFGVHCVEEGVHIPPLQSYGQALKQKDCFSGVLGDDCGASANLMD